MEKVISIKQNKKRFKKQNREMLLTVSFFLLNQEELRKLFWNVKTVKYDQVRQKVNIGINTTNGRLGTTLTKLRKTSKNLSDFLYDQGLTFRRTKIAFYVEKEDIEIERIYSLLSTIEEKNN